MSKPSRPSNPLNATGIARTFFVTTCTAQGRPLFQTDRMANLLIEVLRTCVRSRKFIVHEFVVMPDHLHLLLTVPSETGLEKSVQLIKGGFSYHANRDLGFRGEIWQRGYSDVRITDEESLHKHEHYIHQNPVRAGLSHSPGEYPFGSAHLKKLKLQTATRPET